MESLSNTSFCFGTFYGFVAAGIIALIATRMREARVRMGHKDRQYDQFPDTAHPNLTADGVFRSSQQAGVEYAALFIVLIVVIGLSLAGAFYIIQG